MKKVILLCSFIVATLAMQAQNVFPTNGNVTIDGDYIKMIRPSIGGWARGIFYYNPDDTNTRLGGVGMTGTASTNTVSSLYLAHGHSPWASGLGVYVKTDGNVGIGTTSPQATLDVNGSVKIGNLSIPNDNYKLFVEEGILTEKVKVAPGNDPIHWADFVFDENYDKNTIEEVESYIQHNKHLPNVPSAKEVNQTGVDMVAMDATLLRQIEELWLHVIDLKKENETLKKEVEALKK